MKYVSFRSTAKWFSFLYMCVYIYTYVYVYNMCVCVYKCVGSLFCFIYIYTYIYIYVCESRSVMSHSLWPHGLQSPCNSPGQNNGVGSLSLPQGSSQPRDRTGVSCIAGRQVLYQLSHLGSHIYIFFFFTFSVTIDYKMLSRDFSNGPVLKNPSCSEGDVGSIPGRGIKMPHAMEQLSPLTATPSPPTATKDHASHNWDIRQPS